MLLWLCAAQPSVPVLLWLFPNHLWLFPNRLCFCFCSSRARRGCRQQMQVGHCSCLKPSSKTSSSRDGAHARAASTPFPGVCNQNSVRSRSTLQVQHHGCVFHRWEPCSLQTPHLFTLFIVNFKANLFVWPWGGARQVCSSSGVASSLSVTACQPLPL